MRKHFLLYISLIYFYSISTAQEFSLTGEFKIRPEHRNGFGKLRSINDSLDLASTFITQRSRLHFNFTDTSQHLKMSAVIQDVRNWGSTEPQNIGDKNTLDVHEFWINYNFSSNWAVKAGRQELNYDNGRIIGNADWAQQARSFDAALLVYENKKQKLTFNAAFGLNSKSETLSKEVYDVNNFKQLYLLWINKKYNHLNGSLFFLNNGIEYTQNKSIAVTAKNRRIAFSQTIGSRIEINYTKLSYQVEGYYQGGKDGNSMPLKAWNLGTELIYKPISTLSTSIGYELLSGTSTNEIDGKNHSFTPLYGTNHKFNGLMDYFFVGGRHVNKTGLNDLYLSVRYKKNKYSLDIIPHTFYSDANIVDNNIRLNKYLAFEIDCVSGYKVSEIFTLLGGISALKGSKTLEVISPGGDSNKLNSWLWTQILIKPKFFSINK